MYLQAGGGIVFDSVEEDEYVETINKLKGNVRALEEAESECHLHPSHLPNTDPFYQSIGMRCSRRRERHRHDRGQFDMYLCIP